MRHRQQRERSLSSSGMVGVSRQKADGLKRRREYPVFGVNGRLKLVRFSNLRGQGLRSGWRRAVDSKDNQFLNAALSLDGIGLFLQIGHKS
jgi:hypothetical protein